MKEQKNIKNQPEDKDTGALRLQTSQQLVKQKHFATVLNKMLVRGVRRTWLNAIKQIRMVAALPQLHENVEQAHALRLRRRRVEQVNILHQDFGVQLPLHATQAHVQLGLLLGQQPLLHLGLEAPEQERLENLVQSN